jgi:hypothetical protein
MDVIRVKFSNIPTKDSPTLTGDGIDTSGQIPSTYTSCQIPMKAAMNNVILARSCRDILFFSF